MSDNSKRQGKKPDRRITRSRNQLGDALVALLLEKPFDEATVQEVLDRAQISRSTFYAHYRDKNDLFLSDVDEFMAGMSTLLARSNDQSERVAPVTELFTHVAEMRDFFGKLVEANRLHDLRDLGEAHFARAIEDRLRQQKRLYSLGKEQCAVLAHGLAGALFSQLIWWMSYRSSLTPPEIDAQFHQMVAASVAAAGSPR
ncbi:MAG: TetR/AcrR family transcriptional regulator [Chthoniobacterales bacterium]|nr:TetR/AcrR family transcriptional regulator [Chthoniobacterales bacterium]